MSICGTTFDSKTKIWSGPEVEQLFNPNISIGQAVLHMLSVNPTKISQISDGNGVCLTNDDIRVRTIRIALHIQRLGYRQGDVIGAICRNSENFASVMFAGFLCGTPISTLNPKICKREFEIIQPKLMFCDEENYEMVFKVLCGLGLKCPIFTVKGKIPDVGCVDDLIKPTKDETCFVPPKLINAASSLAVILFSSGTTGPSKAVCISHAQLMQYSEIIYTERILWLNSLYFVTGIKFLISSALTNATRILTDEPLSSELIFRLIEKYKPTLVYMNPSSVPMWEKSPDINFRDLSSVNLFLCGCDKISKIHSTRFCTNYIKSGQFSVCYGLTEIGCMAAIDNPQTYNGSAGKLTAGTEIKILDGSREPLDIGENGEIFIKTPYPFIGYYKNQKVINDIVNKDGWFPTGDYGYIDSNGYLYVHGHKNYIFKYNNSVIIPTKIEECIYQIPGVYQVCVCDVLDQKSNILQPAAAIIQDSKIGLTKNDVFEHIAKNLCDDEYLRGGVYFLNSLPTTLTGKLQRGKIKDIIQKLYTSKNYGT